MYNYLKLNLNLYLSLFNQKNNSLNIPKPINFVFKYERQFY